MNDAIFGALIAGVACVMTSLVGGIIKWFLEKQTVLIDVFKKEASHLASLRLYGHPDVHKLACQFIQTLGVAVNKPKEKLRQELQDAAQQLDGITHGMRNEIKEIVGYIEK